MSDNDERDNVHSQYDMENSIEPEDSPAAKENGPEAETEEAIAHKEKAHRSREINRLEKELEKAQAERDSFKDSYQRTFSDYNNYRKRNQTAVAQAMKTGMGDVVEKMLPVLDNLERALEHVSADENDPLAQGLMMVKKQFLDVLASMGVKEIPAEGCDFDPNLHHAIQQVEAKEGEKPGTVAIVAQKGYLLDERVLRHSMCIVNK